MRNYIIMSVCSIFLLERNSDVVQSARILGIYPYAWASHHILGIKLMNGLAEAGHDITFVSPYHTKGIPDNYKWHDIVLEDQIKTQGSIKEKLLNPDSNPFKLIKTAGLWSQNITKAVLTNAIINEYIQLGYTFDVIIADELFGVDTFQVFSHLFNAPFIIAFTVGANGIDGTKVGYHKSISTQPNVISYIPELMQTLSFKARLKNFIIHVGHELFMSYNLRYQPKVLQQLFPQAPIFEDIYHNVSLILLNSHPSIQPTGPLVPNMIEVGGYHIDPPKPLPSDLQEFLDGAEYGAIYFSLGSEINPDRLSNETQKIFLQKFARIKQRVLWKFDKSIPSKPDNVLIRKWLPQHDILAHKNVKLFITQGGLLSTTETVYNAKPTLCIPIFADQAMNCHIASQAGYSLTLNFKDVSAKKVHTLIEELLRNPRYAENAKKVSAIYHDRPMTPLQTAIYWVEYVIRHKGAPHLKVAGIGMPLYKYYMIDVLLFVIASIVVVLVSVRWLVRLLRAKIKIGTKSKTS